jgi:hypothetical protein
VAFWLWTLCGPIAAVVLESTHSEVASFACPVCTSKGFCPHRVWVALLIHAVGIAALRVAWGRAWGARAEEEAQDPSDRDWGRPLAFLLAIGLVFGNVAQGIATDALVVCGPLAIACACALCTPGLRFPALPVGISVLVPGLLIFYMVVAFQWSPREARTPALVLGLLCMLAVWVFCGIAARGDPELPGRLLKDTRALFRRDRAS